MIKTFYVPVVDFNNEPLMPTNLCRARKWIATGKATPFWKKGVFCVRLNQEPSDRELQTIAIGVDPGSKREAFTVKSSSHTYLNIQMEAVTWVKERMEVRRVMRRSRRNRKTPYRKCRLNRSSNFKIGRLPPSTKSRWQWKLRILNWLNRLYPIETIVVEDVKAKTREGCKKWNRSFSPVQMGKNWFYDEIHKFAKLILKRGYETKELRDKLGLKKSKNKLGTSFDCHCVDSWVLANSCVGLHCKPDNCEILYLKPLKFYRRQLHAFKPSKNGKRRNYGGTVSMGLKRGSLVKHPKYGLVYVGGTSRDFVSLHNMNGERLTQTAKVSECGFICYNTWSSN